LTGGVAVAEAIGIWVEFCAAANGGSIKSASSQSASQQELPSRQTIAFVLFHRS
jgi:hypothetical protein